MAGVSGHGGVVAKESSQASEYAGGVDAGALEADQESIKDPQPEHSGSEGGRARSTPSRTEYILAVREEQACLRRVALLRKCYWEP